MFLLDQKVARLLDDVERAFNSQRPFKKPANASWIIGYALSQHFILMTAETHNYWNDLVINIQKFERNDTKDFEDHDWLFTVCGIEKFLTEGITNGNNDTIEE